MTAIPPPRRPFCPRFNIRLSDKERKELHKLAHEYSDVTKVKVTAAFIVRLALREVMPRMRADLRKAVNGRYHAKIRKESSL